MTQRRIDRINADIHLVRDTVFPLSLTLCVHIYVLCKVLCVHVSMRWCGCGCVCVCVCVCVWSVWVCVSESIFTRGRCVYIPVCNPKVVLSVRECASVCGVFRFLLFMNCNLRLLINQKGWMWNCLFSHHFINRETEPFWPLGGAVAAPCSFTPISFYLHTLMIHRYS